MDQENNDNWNNYISKFLENTIQHDRNKIFFLNSSHSEYYSPENYFYKSNHHGYRSINFKEDVEILTVGCSNTFGVGLPVEFTWPNILKNLIQNKKVANLSICGESIQVLIVKIFNYLDKIGVPKVILCNFPGLERYKSYNSKTNRIESFYDDQILSSQNKKDSLNKKLIIYLTFDYIHMLETICKTLNIKLVWSFWVHTDLMFGNFDDEKEAIKIKSILEDNYESLLLPKEMPYFFNTKENCVFNSEKKLEYKQDFCNKYFNNTNYDFYKQNITSNKDVNLIKAYEDEGYDYEKYSENLLHQFEDCLDFAYDRYNVPSFYQSIDLQKSWSKEKMNKIKKETLNKTYNYAHPGLRFNIFWAEEMAKAISSF